MQVTFKHFTILDTSPINNNIMNELNAISCHILQQKMTWNNKNSSWETSHGSEYQHYSLQGCDATWYLTLQGTCSVYYHCISIMKYEARGSSEVQVPIYLTIQCNIPEDCNIKNFSLSCNFHLIVLLSYLWPKKHSLVSSSIIHAGFMKCISHIIMQGCCVVSQQLC